MEISGFLAEIRSTRNRGQAMSPSLPLPCKCKQTINYFSSLSTKLHRYQKSFIGG